MQFTISARGKPAGEPIQRFIKRHFSRVPLKQIDSCFGCTEPTTLHGGRIHGAPGLGPRDVRAM
jgi:hypothetical protein